MNSFSGTSIMFYLPVGEVMPAFVKSNASKKHVFKLLASIVSAISLSKSIEMATLRLVAYWMW